MAWRSFSRAAPGAIVTSGASARPARSAVSTFVQDLLRRLAVAIEGLAYSSGLAALVGGAMTWVAGRALASPGVPRAAALVACGAFFIYNVDRLRDLTRDRPSSPRRTAFVLRHRKGLVAATVLAGLSVAALLASSPLPLLALGLVVGAIGLLHRRLKRDVRFKIAYVAVAWTAACVGLPWLADFGAPTNASAAPSPAALAWSLLFIGAAVTANLIASNLRAGKSNATGRASEAALLAARRLVIAVLVVAGAAPAEVVPLAWIPAAEAISLCAFRETERFGHLAVDGALLLGALVALVFLGGPGPIGL